jgi:hypothetical protein
MTVSTDVVVIGAGAAGLMAAIEAGRRGRRVVVLEHTDTIGAKILISGGGRCNFTNLDVRPDRFLSENADFCRSALARYTQHDFIALVRGEGIAFYEKTLGQLFCEGAGSARRIVDMLVARAQAAGVRLLTGRSVGDISHGEAFRIATGHETFLAPSLVLATGGLSIPKIGATDFTHRAARRFGLAVTALRPGLTPLTFAPETRAWTAPLSGVSAEAIARCGGAAFREGLLFTHRGLSGPSILQISSYWRPGAPIDIDFAPERDLAAELKAFKAARPKAHLPAALAQVLPHRLAEAMAGLLDPGAGRPLGERKDSELAAVAAALHGWRIVPAGDEGYAKAEVTLGGVSTAELSSKTMEARRARGLYVIGEAVDVTGWLGGYNFQWAWSSGWAAGQAA